MISLKNPDRFSNQTLEIYCTVEDLILFIVFCILALAMLSIGLNVI